MAEQEKNEVSYFFDLAVEQYAELELYFYLDRCMFSSIHATCAGIKNGHIIARVPIAEIDKNPIVWGSEINAYFTVRDAEITHCHFKSRLVRMYNAPPNAMFLVFPLPRHMDHQQRRFSRRVQIDREDAETIDIWHGELQGGDMENLPKLRWIALRDQYCSLGEISANGMRLDFPERNPHTGKIGINDLVLLKGDFAPAGKSCPIFVLGMVVRKKADIEHEDIICVGCHFLSWRKVNDSTNPTWFRADPQEGVGMIAQWVSRNFRSLQV